LEAPSSITKLNLLFKMCMRATRSKVVEWFRTIKVGIGGEDLEAEICDHVGSQRNVRSKYRQLSSIVFSKGMYSCPKAERLFSFE